MRQSLICPNCGAEAVIYDKEKHPSWLEDFDTKFVCESCKSGLPCLNPDSPLKEDDNDRDYDYRDVDIENDDLYDEEIEYLLEEKDIKEN